MTIALGTPRWSGCCSASTARSASRPPPVARRAGAAAVPADQRSRPARPRCRGGSATRLHTTIGDDALSASASAVVVLVIGLVERSLTTPITMLGADHSTR